MTDDLQKLRSAMDLATPLPDQARRQATLDLAGETFDRLQDSRNRTRPISTRTIWMRLGDGAKAMTNALTTKGGLAGTTALAALAMIWVIGNAGRYAPSQPELIITEEVSTRTLDAKTGAEPAPIDQFADGDGIEENAVARSVTAQQTMPEPDASADRGGVLSLAAPTEERAGDRLRAHPLPDRPTDLAVNTEVFPSAAPNTLKVTSEAPVSTFSADVDTASWSIIRSSLMRGALPPRDAVRIEEMVNYFSYAYPTPSGPHPFGTTVNVGETPWNPDTQLVRIGIQGEMPARDDRPPLNLVFLIDTSGSMQNAAKLPLLIQSFRLMLAELRPEDEIAIVAYAGSAGLVLPATPASDRTAIEAALASLQAGGGTAGQAGLEQAYDTAAAMSAEGEVTRVLLATDGDFNVGLSDPDALEDYIAEKRDEGVYLSVLGFGRGNLDDATMQALAQNGNGMAAYIDTLSEARKVLVDQLTGALFPIADDVKLQVEWNPATVAEYRLIGYETRALAREDFNNDQVDAGEIGAGLSVTALYEITPVGSPAILNDPLRYQAQPAASGSQELGFLRLRYKSPGASDSTLIETPILPADGALTSDASFAAAIAGFGQLLRDRTYLNGWGFEDAIALAAASRGDDPFGYRAEALTLMRLAESLSQ